VKPAVFPVPVCADANTSFLLKLVELLFVVLEGVVYPFLLMAFNKASDSLMS
jgi:hypothetical protein